MKMLRANRGGVWVDLARLQGSGLRVQGLGFG